MDLAALAELVLLQKSSAARLDILEAQIRSLDAEVRSIKNVHKNMEDPKTTQRNDTLDRLIDTFYKSQSLTVDLITEFKRLKKTVIGAMFLTVMSVVVASFSMSSILLYQITEETTKSLNTIIANQLSMEDVILANTAKHTQTQEMLRQCLHKDD